MKVNPDLIQEIISIYDQRLVKLKELLRVTDQQTEVIAEGDYDKIFDLLNKRQEVVDLLSKLDKEKLMPKLKQLAHKLQLTIDEQFTSQLLELQLPHRRELKEVIEQNRKIFHLINRLSEKQIEKLIDQKQKVKQELNQLDQGITVNESYQQKNHNVEGKFIDKKE